MNTSLYVSSRVAWHRATSPSPMSLSKRAYPFLWSILVVPVLVLSSQTAQAQTCMQAAPGTMQWQNAPFPAQTGIFSITMSAQPQAANGDVLVALSQGTKTHWSGLAAIARFNNANTIDVRDGSAYRADQKITYWPGDTRNLRFDVDVPNKLYSVYHNVPGNVSWQPLAYNYAFRTEQQGVLRLDNFVAEAEAGALYACVSDPVPWKTARPGTQQWQNTAISSLGGPGTYVLKWRVRPAAANSDALLALAAGPQTNWRGLGAIVRFNSSNTIDVRNGSTYMADTVMPYAANQTYDVKMYVQMPLDGRPGNYSVWVAAPNQSAVQIANQYAFRTEQQGATQFDHWVLEAEAGGISADLYDRDLM